MKLIRTPEFSIEANPMFETVRIFGGSIALKPQTETMFSPQMTVWTTAAKKGTSPGDWFTDALKKDGGSIVERKPISLAGMSGEISKIRDSLEDEAGKMKDWYRLRALLVSADGVTWYHATAMAGDGDLPVIEQDFVRMLGSIHVELMGDAAQKAHEAGEEDMKGLFERLRRKMEQAGANQEAARTAGAAVSVEDVETRFDRAVASVGLDDKRDILRKIAMPTLSLTESGEAEDGALGISRIGGGPDLPEGMDWPRDLSGFHLNFLAQINLADLPDRYEILPADGLLSFFTGTDYSDWKVIHTPADARLIRHALPEDAEATAIDAMSMVSWDSEKQRFVADRAIADGLSVETDDQGRLTFLRDGKPVIALASEYEISGSSQLLRFEPSLSVLYGLPGPDNPKVYADAGLDDPFDFWQAIDAGFKVGDGPQHQMFGVTGVRNLEGIQILAAKYAGKQGWDDITMPADWFILLKLASGGEAGFSFSDHGDYIFMVNRKDAAKGDFSRIYALVDSG